MPWRETSPMDERLRFIQDYRSGCYAMNELCERYGISRKTGYKWVGRFEAEGASGLADRSRAPLHCPHRMPVSVREALLEARRRHPTWGPRKLLAWIERRRPRVEWPAASSVGDLLRREGLVAARRRRPRLRRVPTPRGFPVLTTPPTTPSAWSTQMAASTSEAAPATSPTALKGERVGFLEVDDGIWAVYFSTIEIVRWNERTRTGPT